MKITQQQYEKIADGFPRRRGDAAIDNLAALNAMPHVLEHGCRRRGLPGSFGNRRSICTRMSRRRGNGVLDRIFARQPVRRRKAEQHADPAGGRPTAADGAPDKPRGRKIGPVARHRSGGHRRAVSGIGLPMPLRTDGARHIPADFGSCSRSADGPTGNGRFRRMPRAAAERGFAPEIVLFGSRYSGSENLERIRSLGRRRPTRLKYNRHIDPDGTGDRPPCEVVISESGDTAHLEGYGLIRAFRTVKTDNDIEYRATDDLGMTDMMRLRYAEIGRMIKTYHLGIRRFCGIERCRARSESAQRGHIETAPEAFLRLEYHCFVKGVSWFGAEISMNLSHYCSLLKQKLLQWSIVTFLRGLQMAGRFEGLSDAGWSMFSDIFPEQERKRPGMPACHPRKVMNYIFS